MKIFIDTWGWITLIDKRLARYREIKKFYQTFRKRGGNAYTSDYILDETITAPFSHHPFDKAETGLTLIEQSITEGFLHLEWVSQSHFDNAIKLRRKYADKPRISFTDFTSMVVMRELGITDVLTDDDHFIQVGMGFNKAP